MTSGPALGILELSSIARGIVAVDALVKRAEVSVISAGPTTPGKYVSLSYWRDEAAVRDWRNRAGHRMAQAKGRAGVFADYRLRVAAVVRDYGMEERAEAPQDSVAIHG